MSEHYDPETYSQEWNYLQTGTIIDQYMIERELAHGGFSSVYLARQLKDQVQVAIKEYLPRKLAHRTWNNVVTPHNEENRKLFMNQPIVVIDLLGIKIAPSLFNIERNRILATYCRDNLLSLIKGHNLSIKKAVLTCHFSQNSDNSPNRDKFELFLLDKNDKKWSATYKLFCIDISRQIIPVQQFPLVL